MKNYPLTSWPRTWLLVIFYPVARCPRCIGQSSNCWQPVQTITCLQIGEEEFLEPTTEMDKEVHMERFPPSISYKVVYTYPHLRSANPKYTTLKINMAGTNKKVTFGCRIEEGETGKSEPCIDRLSMSRSLFFHPVYIAPIFTVPHTSPAPQLPP